MSLPNAFIITKYELESLIRLSELGIVHLDLKKNKKFILQILNQRF